MSILIKILAELQGVSMAFSHELAEWLKIGIFFFSAIEVNVNPNRSIRIGDDNHVRTYGKFYCKVCF